MSRLKEKYLKLVLTSVISGETETKLVCETSELVDSKRGETILKQAHNGVFVRMAILNKILKGNN